MKQEQKKKHGISSRVTIHDVYQFEIKLEYDLEELEKTDNYKIETFLFIPSSLQVNERTYPSADFYRDLQNYIRFKTPSYSFKLILSEDFERSPLVALKTLFERLRNHKEHEKKTADILQAIKELKLLGVMVRARLRDFKYFVRRKIARGDKSGYIIRKLSDKIDRGIGILQRLRSIKKDFSNNFPEEKELFKYFRIAEEYISCVFEEEVIAVFRIVKKHELTCDGLDVIETKFKTFCKDEQEFRRSENFQLQFDNREIAKERYLYHLAQYKKVISSVLYLDTNRRRKRGLKERIIDSIVTGGIIIPGLSAAYFLAPWIVPFLVPFSLGAGALYILRDRTRDFIYSLLHPKVLSRLPDHVNEIRDTKGEGFIRLGEIREKVSFSEGDKIDSIVFTLRNQTVADSIVRDQVSEEILAYQKEILINAGAIKKRHTRTINISDIMRFNVRRYLASMDNPDQVIHYFDEEKDKLTTTTGGRTYHLNLILKYSSPKKGAGGTRFERYRIVTNKWGIVRIEFTGEM